MNATELSVDIGEKWTSVQPGYDGERHYDTWVEHKVVGGVSIWTYPDGQLIRVDVPTGNCKEHTIKGYIK